MYLHFETRVYFAINFHSLYHKMHLHIIKITSLILSFTRNQNIVVQCAGECTMSAIPIKLANCSRTSYVDVPQDQDTDIQALDISYNKHQTINESSFQRYPNLEKFIMRKAEFTKGGGISLRAFAKLSKLKYIDLTNSIVAIDPLYVWPDSLKILIVQMNYMPKLIVDNLKYLEELHANSIALATFPDFNQQAPIRRIDVENCPIQEIKVMDIAPFCNLIRMGLQFPDRSYLQSHVSYCLCARLKAWINDKHIRANPLNCTLPYSYTDQIMKNCDTTFTEKESEVYRRCRLRAVRKVTWSKLMYLVGALLFITLSLLASAILVYKNRSTLKQGGESSGQQSPADTPEPIADTPQQVDETPDEVQDEAQQDTEPEEN